MDCTTKLVAYTQPSIHTPCIGPEDLVAFCARVSSGRDYDERGEDYEGLLKYCIRNRHWSIFEMANVVVEVSAPRDITRQLLRHRSFSFQEFSQRYSDDIEMARRDYRHQDLKNRQNSLDTLSIEETWEAKNFESAVGNAAYDAYHNLREMGVAKECARVVLPEGLTMSTLYVNGTLRSWLHYLEVRLDPTTQKEHRIMAQKIKDVLEPVFPITLGMTDE